MTGNRQFYFDPYAAGLEVLLGPTEAKLMDLAWERGHLTVKSALFHLGDRTPRAYTTVMTVLNRLVDKGLLDRKKTGRSYTYAVAVKRDDFIEARLTVIRACLQKNFGSTS